MAGLVLAATLGLTACDPGDGSEDAATPESDSVEITVTAAFDVVEGGSGTVGFVPDTDSPWTGLIVSAPPDGGLDIFNADGEALERVTGPRLNSLAVAPRFALRGESLPLVIGVDPTENRVRGYVLIRSEPTAVEAPLAAIEPEGGVAAVCFVDEAPGHLDIAVLGRDARVTMWRVRDTGGDLIDAEQTGSLSLPAPARACTSLQDNLYVAGPTLPLTRIGSSGNIEARGGPNALSLSSGMLLGRAVVVATTAQSSTVEIVSARDFERLASVEIVNGMSTPGVETPVAITMTDASYGGTAYQSGLVAVVDGADNRIRVVARESFARAIAPRDDNPLGG